MTDKAPGGVNVQTILLTLDDSLRVINHRLQLVEPN
jgi:hypothetical protein